MVGSNICAITKLNTKVCTYKLEVTDSVQQRINYVGEWFVNALCKCIIVLKRHYLSFSGDLEDKANLIFISFSL